MAVSYGAEQAASQMQRVAGYAQQGIQMTAGLAADFEDQMARVGALSTAGMGEAEAIETLDALEKKARELGANTRYTAREAAEGMEFLAMAGFDAAKQLETIPAVLSLATVGKVEIAQSADIATNIMSGFGLAAEESTWMVDRLAKALVSGNVNLQELGVTMKYAAPLAKTLGQGAESMLGWADILGDAGLKGSTAGTGIRSVLLSLSAPKDKSEAIFKKYGVKRTDEKGNLRDATDIMAELGLAMARSGKGSGELAQEMKEIFGKQFVSHASVLMGAAAKGIATQDDDLSSLQAVMKDAGVTEEDRAKIWGESLQSRIGKIKDSDGTADEMAKKMEATTKGQWRAFKSQMEETGIVIGEQVLPILSEIMKELTPWLLKATAWAKENSGTVKFLAKASIALVGLTAILAPVLHLVSAILGLVGVAGRTWQGARGLAARLGLGGVSDLPGGRGPQPRDARGRYMSWGDPRARQSGGLSLGGGMSTNRRRAGRRIQIEAPVKAHGPDPKGRSAGGGGAGAKAMGALIGWEIGTGIGEAINSVLKEFTGRDGVHYFEKGVIKPVDRLFDKWFHDSDPNVVTVNIRDEQGNIIGTETYADLDALNGGITATRGGAKFLSDINGETEESKKKLSQLEREKDIARQLGVSYETIRRARQQGIDLNALANSPQFLQQFVAQEQGRDVALAKEVERKKQRELQIAQAAQEARKAALAKGWSEEEAQSAASITAKHARGQEQSGLLGAFARTLSEPLKQAMMEGVLAGAAKAKIIAVAPGVDPVTGAEVGG